MKNDLTVLNQFEEVTHDELLDVDGGSLQGVGLIFVGAVGFGASLVVATIPGLGLKGLYGAGMSIAAIGSGVRLVSN